MASTLWWPPRWRHLPSTGSSDDSADVVSLTRRWSEPGAGVIGAGCRGDWSRAPGWSEAGDRRRSAGTFHILRVRLSFFVRIWFVETLWCLVGLWKKKKIVSAIFTPSQCNISRDGIGGSGGGGGSGGANPLIASLLTRFRSVFALFVREALAAHPPPSLGANLSVSETISEWFLAFNRRRQTWPLLISPPPPPSDLSTNGNWRNYCQKRRVCSVIIAPFPPINRISPNSDV